MTPHSRGSAAGRDCAALILIILALGAGGATAEPAPEWGASLFAPSVDAGRAVDARRALPRTPFYEEPAVEPAAAPGTLVRAQAATDLDLPAGVTATRILYHTRTADDRDTLASGVVLVPYGKAPNEGWPLLAWSHGTSGVVSQCAPSLMRSLFYNWEGLYEYVMLGYAVVATDYAGLGTGGRHAYLDHLSNATDVINSVTAARAAVPDLGKRWLVIGHSQGGLSSLGVAELEGQIRDQDFLGTVALAGASDLDDAIDSIMQVRLPILNGLVAFWIYGIKTVYPQLDLADVLTPEALAIYTSSVEDGCSAASGAFAHLSTDQLLRRNWRANPYVRKFIERNRPGALSTYGPILLIGGGADVLFTDAAGQKVFERMCAAGDHVQRRMYPGLGHDALVYGSIKDQMDWIAARFVGHAVPNECPDSR